MSEAAKKARVPYEEYLRQERLEQQKHEWIDGEVYAMVGGTPEHARLQGRLIRILGAALEGGPCEVYTTDLRVRSRATNIATYADITVVCGDLETDSEDGDAVTNPTLIIEVLSPTTEAYDRGSKGTHYRQIPSLREYVLVSQDTQHIEIFRRNVSGNWSFLEAFAGESVVLESVGCTVSVDEVYKKPQKRSE
ncbi:MAG TPA: Uma2 family endonuclease [Enhygromyxa sp.]|nr:Uma2 family endonuclease [Enhygromyxa sp.]